MTAFHIQYRFNMKQALFGLLAATASISAFALDVSLSSSEISFSDAQSDKISVTVSGPDNYSDDFSVNGNFLSLGSSEINSAKDGQYTYEVISIKKVGTEFVDASNGRNAGYKDDVDSSSASGNLNILNGSIIIDSEAE